MLLLQVAIKVIDLEEQDDDMEEIQHVSGVTVTSPASNGHGPQTAAY